MCLFLKDRIQPLSLSLCCIGLGRFHDPEVVEQALPYPVEFGGYTHPHVWFVHSHFVITPSITLYYTILHYSVRQFGSCVFKSVLHCTVLDVSLVSIYIYIYINSVIISNEIICFVRYSS